MARLETPVNRILVNCPATLNSNFAIMAMLTRLLIIYKIGIVDFGIIALMLFIYRVKFDLN